MTYAQITLDALITDDLKCDSINFFGKNSKKIMAKFRKEKLNLFEFLAKNNFIPVSNTFFYKK